MNILYTSVLKSTLSTIETSILFHFNLKKKLGNLDEKKFTKTHIKESNTIYAMTTMKNLEINLRLIQIYKDMLSYLSSK
jgi:hypothetical protein